MEKRWDDNEKAEGARSGQLLRPQGRANWTMKTETKDFLVREYDQVWRQTLGIQDVRNKALALYLTLFGAVAAAGLPLVGGSSCGSPGPWIGNRWVDTLVCLPRYYAVPALAFLLLTSAVMLLLQIRWHVLMAEYMTSLNRIRAAFLSEDSDFLHRYLVLPTGQARARVFRINFWVLVIVDGLSALVVVFASWWFLNLPLGQRLAQPQAIWSLVPVVVAGVWFALWIALYYYSATKMDTRLCKLLKCQQPAGETSSGSGGTNRSCSATTSCEV